MGAAAVPDDVQGAFDEVQALFEKKAMRGWEVWAGDLMPELVKRIRREDEEAEHARLEEEATRQCKAEEAKHKEEAQVAFELLMANVNIELED